MCEAETMPLNDEPCEAPCPEIEEGGSGNGTSNDTVSEGGEVTDSSEEGKHSEIQKSLYVGIM